MRGKLHSLTRAISAARSSANNADSACSFEKLEPRILLSADLLGGAVATDLSQSLDNDFNEYQEKQQDLDQLVAPFVASLGREQSIDSAGSLPVSLDLASLDNYLDGEQGVNLESANAPVFADGLAALFADTATDITVDSATDTPARQEIIFIDAATPDYQQLVEGIATGSSQTQFLVFILDDGRDGVEQIGEVLADYQGIDAIHLISHGSEGQVNLGSGSLNTGNVNNYAAALTDWQKALDGEADLLIYGCNLAGNAAGQDLLQALAQLTGADIAASDDLTGSAELGGDWDLEYQLGQIETAIAFNAQLQQSWQNTLATFTVNTFDDTIDVNLGDGLALDVLGNTSLRAAIMQANNIAGDDTIILGPGTYTLDVGGPGDDAAVEGDLDIRTGITITGADAATTVIDGGGIDRVFEVLTVAGSLTMTDVTVQGGVVAGDNGGGINVSQANADMSLNRVIVTGNQAADGAGIYIRGTANLTDVTLSGNNTTGGATSQGGGLYVWGTATLDNVTVSGNTAGIGGGIYNEGTSGLTNVTISGNIATGAESGGLHNTFNATLTNVTVSNNTAQTQGGGISNTSSISISNTIVANNVSIGGSDHDVSGTFTSDGSNVIEDTGVAIGFGSDTVGDPNLGALADSGGFTQTHALLDNSIAIDAGTNSGAPADDQRGYARADGLVDVGAYEATTFGLVWVDQDAGKIQTANIDGSGVSDLLTGLNSPLSVAVDAQGGKVYWSDDVLNTIQRANLDGTGVETIVTSVPGTIAIDLNVAGGKIYWVEGSGGQMMRADLDGTNAESLTGSPVTPTGIALDVANNKVYWADAGNDRIKQTSLTGGGTSNLISSGLGSSSDIALDLVAGQLYWSDSVSGEIRRVDLDGTNLTTVISGPGDRYGLAIDSSAGKVYWTDDTTDQIHRANLDGSGIEALVSGITTPRDIDVIDGVSNSTMGAAYEPFSYSAGSLEGQNGGTGWANGWTIVTNGDPGPSAVVNATGLGSPTGTLPVQGGTAELNSSSQFSQSRDLVTSLGADGTSVWFSYLIKADVASFQGISLELGDASDDKVSIGTLDDDFIITKNRSTTGAAWINNVITDGQTYLLAVKVDFAAGNDTVTLYLDPTPGLASPDSVTTVQLTSADLGGFTQVAMTGAGAGNTSSLDEIRVGASFADVAPAGASSFVVTNTNATGAGSLEQAILNTNVNPGYDTITFNIPGSGPHVIMVDADGLPDIDDQVFIDGWSEPDYLADGVPVIQIDGSSAGAVDGLRLLAGSDGSTIRGLSITNFSDAQGIDIRSDSNSILGNYLGVATDGTTLGNNNAGIILQGGASDNQIGDTGTDEGNLVTGGSFAGIQITGTNTDVNRIQNNDIGLDATGTVVNVGTFGIGMWNGPDSNEIGGTGADEGNRIAGFSTGIIVDSNSADTTDTSILGNQIWGNSNYGINLENEGITPNDDFDLDSGSNDLLNYPVLSSVANNGPNLDINFNLDVPAGNYRIEFFDNPGGISPSGYGGGENFLDAITVVSTGTGMQSMGASLIGVNVADVKRVTATVTEDLGAGNFGATSEFSRALPDAIITATKDTYVNSGATGSNYGISSSLVVDKTGGSLGNQRALLEFDLSSLPVGATITSATLQMQSSANDGAFEIDVYRVLQPWDEGVADGTADASNWNERQDGINWTDVGGDVDDLTKYDTLSTSATGQHFWDITSLVTEWYDGTNSNYGLMLASDDLGTGVTVTYYSSEAGLATAPQLLVNYTLPGGNAPAFQASGPFTVDEHAAVTTVVGDVDADDGDGGAADAGITYDITGNLDTDGDGIKAFTIDSASGVITVDDADDLDFETAHPMVITVEADDGVFQTSTSVTINLNNINEAPTVSVPGAIFINEIHYDNIGADTGEAIEIAGVAGNDLNGWTLVLYNGFDGSVYDTLNLSGTIPNQADNFGTLAFNFPADGIQNATSGNPDGLALVDSTGTVVQFLSYEGAFTATDGPANGILSTDIGVAEDNGSTLVGDSLQLSGSGATFTWMAPSLSNFGAINTGQDFANIAAATNQTVNEDAPLVFSSGNGNAITVDDVDAAFGVAPDPVSVKLDVSNGTLTLGSTTDLGTVLGDGTNSISFTGTIAELNNALEGLTYQGDLEFSGSDTLTVLVDDQANSGLGANLLVNGVVHITVDSLNDAPLLDNTGSMSLLNVLQDNTNSIGDLVSDIILSATGDRIMDADAGDPEGIAVIGVDDSNGRWEYSIDDGDSWSSFVVSGVANGAIDDTKAVLLDEAARIRFVPNASYVGSGGDISFQAWDQTTGSIGQANVDVSTNGDATAFSADVETASVTVSAAAGISNSVPGAQPGAEDTTLTFSVAGLNPISISDGSAGDATLRVTLSSTNGILTLAGTTGISIIGGADGSASMTLVGLESAINTALDGLEFDPDTGYTGAANVQVTTEHAASLEGHYSFDDPATLATLGNNDTPDGGPNATITGATAVLDGARGQVLSFDGNDTAQVSGRFSDPADVTLAAWVNLNDGANDAEVISIGDRVVLRLDMNFSGLGIFGSFNNGSGFDVTSSGAFIEGTGWHHVAYTIDDANNSQSLYIDGQLVASTSYTSSIAYGGVLDTTIGSHANASSYFMDGLIDDARIYSRALDAGEINALASDGVSATSNVAINVSAVNFDPTLDQPIPDQGATEDSPFSYTFAANTFGDADAGDTLTYTSDASGWLSFDAATRTFSGTPLNGDVGTITVTVTADDGNGGTAAVDTFDIVVANSNDDPTLDNAIANQVATEDSAFTFTFPANTFGDVDAGDTLTYTSDASGWLSFDAATRTFNGTPLNADVGTTTVTVTADDGNGGTPATETFDIVISNSNDDPTLDNAIANQVATEDSAFTFTFAANTFGDVDVGDTLTYSSDASGWLSFNAATRTFAGTPLNADVGTITVTVTADDGNGGTAAVDTFDIVVANSNDDPTLDNAIGNQVATEDSAFTFTFPANTFGDVDAGDTLTYTSDASGWLSFDAATRTFSGTPLNADVGTTTVTVTADDGNGGTVSDSFDIIIANANDAPTGSVTIDNTAPVQGDTLAAANTLADLDGLSGAISYQWQRDGSDISGATGTTYTTVAADAGFTISVTASYTDDRGTLEAVTSLPTAAVVNVNDLPAGVVTISGLAQEDQTLTAGNNLSDADGLGAINYQWQRDGADISGATGVSYTLGDNDVDATITVVASYIDNQGTPESIPSAPTAPVANVNDAPTGTVTISGSVAENSTLVASHNLADNDGLGVLSYEWQRNGEAISGVTGDSYTLTDDDAGAVISVQVSYIDGHGTAESVASDSLNLALLTVPDPVSEIADEPATGVTDTEEPIPDSEQPEAEVDPETSNPVTIETTPTETESPQSEVTTLQNDGDAAVQSITSEIDRKDDGRDLAPELNDPLSEQPAQPVSLVTLQANFTLYNDPLVLMNFEGFSDGIDELRDEVADARGANSTVVGSTFAVSAGLSAGYVAWLARSGAILSSVLSALPAWRFIDPLPVLTRTSDGSGDDESLQSLIGDSAADNENETENESTVDQQTDDQADNPDGRN